MKLNPDLMREILLYVEEHEKGNGLYKPAKVEGYTREQIGYHTKMLKDAGLLRIDHVKSNGKGSMYDEIIEGMSFEGHQFLAASREPKTWNKAKETMKEKGIGMTIDAIFKVLIRLAQSQVDGIL